MSREAPLACTQFHTSHNIRENEVRGKVGWSAISCRMNVTSDSVIHERVLLQRLPITS
jgi:hypothetical protein